MEHVVLFLIYKWQDFVLQDLRSDLCGDALLRSEKRALSLYKLGSSPISPLHHLRQKKFSCIGAIVPSANSFVLNSNWGFKSLFGHPGHLNSVKQNSQNSCFKCFYTHHNIINRFVFLVLQQLQLLGGVALFVGVKGFGINRFRLPNIWSEVKRSEAQWQLWPMTWCSLFCSFSKKRSTQKLPTCTVPNPSLELSFFQWFLHMWCVNNDLIFGSQVGERIRALLQPGLPSRTCDYRKIRWGRAILVGLYQNRGQQAFY